MWCWTKDSEMFLFLFSTGLEPGVTKKESVWGHLTLLSHGSLVHDFLVISLQLSLPHDPSQSAMSENHMMGAHIQNSTNIGPNLHGVTKRETYFGRAFTNAWSFSSSFELDEFLIWEPPSPLLRWLPSVSTHVWNSEPYCFESFDARGASSVSGWNNIFLAVLHGKRQLLMKMR